MKKLLFLNACINRDTSRTLQLANALILLLQKSDNFEITELILEDENIPAVLSKQLKERNELLKKGDYNNDTFRLAIQFKEADFIVVAAPYWDFGFPAILKTYIERINLPGILWKFDKYGKHIGMSKASKLYYVTTRGSFVGDECDLGYGTFVQLGKFCGIREIKCISIDGLDMGEEKTLMSNAIASLPARL